MWLDAHSHGKHAITIPGDLHLIVELDALMPIALIGQTRQLLAVVSPVQLDKSVNFYQITQVKTARSADLSLVEKYLEVMHKLAKL